MKALFAWIGIALACFAGLSAATHFEKTAHPALVLVAVDTSYAMGLDKGGLDRALSSITRRYSRYLIMDAMTILKDWDDSAGLASKPSFFGSPDYSALKAAAKKRAAESGARRIVFIVAEAVPSELAGSEVLVVR